MNVGLINGGLEMLAGILLAHLNRNGSTSRGPQKLRRAGGVAACYLQEGVTKTHGGSFRSEEVYRRLFPRGDIYRCAR